jgi:hypothetical protein
LSSLPPGRERCDRILSYRRSTDELRRAGPKRLALAESAGTRDGKSLHQKLLCVFCRVHRPVIRQGRGEGRFSKEPTLILSPPSNCS